MSVSLQLMTKSGLLQSSYRRALILHRPTISCAATSKISFDQPRYFSTEDETKKEDSLIYEGPFASLALRLKRISITSAAASIIGVPILLTYGSNIPASGQLAVGGTAILAATGSTAALSFCFSPYLHKLEWIPVRQCKTAEGKKEKSVTSQTQLMKATTRNFFAMQVETVFDPDVDVTHDPKTYRPFCNFMVKGLPLFIHPELLNDTDLRIKLLGKEKGTLVEDEAKEDGKKKDPDDEFL